MNPGIMLKSAKKKKGMIVGFVTLKSAEQSKTVVEKMDGQTVGNIRTLKAHKVVFELVGVIPGLRLEQVLDASEIILAKVERLDLFHVFAGRGTTSLCVPSLGETECHVMGSVWGELSSFICEISSGGVVRGQGLTRIGLVVRIVVDDIYYCLED
ncbi:zinc finger CCCH domain-containing protein 24 [Salvia divinorum]|uniref:Zinc finger CCCH domain-containing protein 24 n=1 Tax=Salvia divinorum TaxID=28513 RepID=A0ABD1FQV5_SALDI